MLVQWKWPGYLSLWSGLRKWQTFPGFWLFYTALTTTSSLTWFYFFKHHRFCIVSVCTQHIGFCCVKRAYFCPSNNGITVHIVIDERKSLVFVCCGSLVPLLLHRGGPKGGYAHWVCQRAVSTVQVSPHSYQAFLHVHTSLHKHTVHTHERMFTHMHTHT